MVKLRRYTLDDVPKLFEAGYESRGPGFTEWMPWCHEDYSQEESAQFILSRQTAWDRGEDFGFAILDEETDDYLGGAGINQIQTVHGYGNLGYWIRRSKWGRGYAAAATREVARFAFEELKLVRVEIVVAVSNTKSVRVAEKAGAHHEGILRNRLKLGGIPHDAHMYSLIP